jgi:hypothetical protein
MFRRIGSTSQTADRALRIADTVAAIAEALGGPQGRRAMVCEATGGYERPLMLVAAQLGLPIRRVHPNRARASIGAVIEVFDSQIGAIQHAIDALIAEPTPF